MSAPRIGSVAMRVCLDLAISPRGTAMWSKEISRKYGVHPKAMHQSLKRAHDTGWLVRNKMQGDNELFYCAGPELVKAIQR